MADELKISAIIGFSKGGAKLVKELSDKITITGDSFTHGVQSIGTSEEEVAQGVDLGTPGYVFAINLDSTNYVEIGSTTGVYDIKLQAGEFAIWRHNSASAILYAKANSSACLLEYCIFET